jgi:hypothetical protein
LVADGKQTIRFDTFGDETRWTDVLFRGAERHEKGDAVWNTHPDQSV